MNSNENIVYHEVDFLLPAQRFHIQFSYVSQKGFSFFREYALRLIHLTPLSKSQLATYLGLTKKEVSELVNDLADRGEISLTAEGQIKLSDKAEDYFYDLGESPQIASVQDSAANLSFDLATFTCLKNESLSERWDNGIPLNVSHENISKSQTHVEKHFQHQFSQILDNSLLPSYINNDSKENPTVYTVNLVNKLKQFPLRLSTSFKMDIRGKAIERDDYEDLKSSDLIHELTTAELGKLSRRGNFVELVQAMNQIEDKDSLSVFTSEGSPDPRLLRELNLTQENKGVDRLTFLGPSYKLENWELIVSILNNVLVNRKNETQDFSNSELVWIAPSDPFWGKSERIRAALSSIRKQCKIVNKDKSIRYLYSPKVFVPIEDRRDKRTSRQWVNSLSPSDDILFGLVEGFLGGNVEVLFLDDEFVVVIYHVNIPLSFPVTVPMGFISQDKEVVKRLSAVVREYIEDSCAFDKPNNCGELRTIIKS